MSRWRDHAKPIISEVIERVGTEDMKLLRKKLREVYPFGQRKYHPYKIWCDEIKVQLGTKKRKVSKADVEIPGQLHFKEIVE